MHRYEQLDLWKRGCELAVRTYSATRSAALGADRSLAWQMRRSAASIPANVAEGATRGAVAEFAHFLAIAAASAAELHTHAVVAGRVGAVDMAEAAAIGDEATALRRMAVALRARMRRTLAERSR